MVASNWYKISLCFCTGNDVTDTILFASETVSKLQSNCLSKQSPPMLSLECFENYAAKIAQNSSKENNNSAINVS
jgi:hypothetical protein